MSTNTLNPVVSGQIIVEGFWNDIQNALEGDVVGRDTTGVPASGQNLGTVALPWGTIRATTLILGGSAVDTSQITAPVNRLVSGKTRSTSNQPAFITPNGSALSAMIAAASKSLVVDINGSAVTLSANLTLSSLTAAPSSQNTALINDTAAANQADTRLWGEPEHRKSVTIDTVGTNITALVGKYASFMLTHGGNTEYFFAFVKSATELTEIRRGYFYDSGINPKNRITFSNDDTITLLKTGWVFLQNDAATTDVSYNAPVWGYTSPSGAVTGDYWYDLLNNVWKRYDGATFQIINRVLIGVVVNSTTACIGARCMDFYGQYREDNTFAITKLSTEIAESIKLGCRVNVMGKAIEFKLSRPSWNITTDLAIAADMYTASEQASTLYYLYVTDEGKTVISDISPYFRSDLLGEYHPHNPWRCVGFEYNDSGSDLQAANGINVKENGYVRVQTANGYGSFGVVTRRWTTFSGTSTDLVYTDDATNGSSFICAWPGGYDLSFYDNFASASNLELTLNNPDPSTQTVAYWLMGQYTGATNGTGCVSAAIDLKIGDKIGTETGSLGSGADPAEAGAIFRRVS